jgi:tetratricopeptide (TPR) repeat protein
MTALLASLLVLTATPSSKAQQAADLARKSMTEYNVGKFDAALEDATNAYMLDARPGFLYNIGQCQRALHNWERAEFFYRGYLRDKPDAPNRKSVEELIAEMQTKEKEEAAAKAADAAAKAKPTPAEVPIVVEAAPAPDAAVTAPPPRHGHALAIGLGTAGIVLLGLMGVSIYEVVTYQNEYGASAIKGTQFNVGAYKTAVGFEYVEFISGGLGIAGLTSAALTW